MRTRTLLVAIPAAVLVLAGCGGHKSAGVKHTVPTALAVSTVPLPPAKSATPTTKAPARGQAAVEAQVKQALAAADQPIAGGEFQARSCVVGYMTWDFGKHNKTFRAKAVASFHKAGWKDGPGGGPEETELTNADGWQVFVSQRDLGKVNGTGSPTQELGINAICT